MKIKLTHWVSCRVLIILIFVVSIIAYFAFVAINEVRVVKSQDAASYTTIGRKFSDGRLLILALDPYFFVKDGQVEVEPIALIIDQKGKTVKYVRFPQDLWGQHGVELYVNYNTSSVWAFGSQNNSYFILDSDGDEFRVVPPKNKPDLEALTLLFAYKP